MADAGQLEEREVVVNDPGLSADANQRLTEAVREVVGADRVRVPADRPRVSQGERPRIPFGARITSTATMSIGVLAVALCVGLIILTAAGKHWWLTGLSMVVLGGALYIVTKTIMGLASTSEYPDPGLVALLSEEGLRSPENRFTELVHEFTPVSDDEDRNTAVEDDPAQAASEQRDAVTPSGGASTAVGPGD
jgi:hypothetical protein